MKKKKKKSLPVGLHVRQNKKYALSFMYISKHNVIHVNFNSHSCKFQQVFCFI